MITKTKQNLYKFLLFISFLFLSLILFNNIVFAKNTTTEVTSKQEQITIKNNLKNVYQEKLKVLIEDTKKEVLSLKEIYLKKMQGKSVDEKRKILTLYKSEYKKILTKYQTNFKILQNEYKKKISGINEVSMKMDVKNVEVMSGKSENTLKKEISEKSLQDIRENVLNELNNVRKEQGLSTFVLNDKLNQAAQTHSLYMKSNNEFEHNTKNGSTPAKRVRETGYLFSSIAENIAFGEMKEHEVVDAWMNSEGHKANIFNGSFTDIGIGFDGNYWTLVFGKNYKK